MKADIWSFVTNSGFLLDLWKLLFTDQIIKNSKCVCWSKDLVENLFQNMRLSLWNAQQSFWNTWLSIWNTRPSFWGFRRKLKARPRVWKAWQSVWKAQPSVCPVPWPMLSQSATVIYYLWLWWTFALEEASFQWHI